jgi:hypothetical protein
LGICKSHFILNGKNKVAQDSHTFTTWAREAPGVGNQPKGTQPTEAGQKEERSPVKVTGVHVSRLTPEGKQNQ